MAIYFKNTDGAVKKASYVQLNIENVGVRTIHNIYYGIGNNVKKCIYTSGESALINDSYYFPLYSQAVNFIHLNFNSIPEGNIKIISDPKSPYKIYTDNNVINSAVFGNIYTIANSIKIISAATAAKNRANAIFFAYKILPIDGIRFEENYYDFCNKFGSCTFIGNASNFIYPASTNKIYLKFYNYADSNFNISNNKLYGTLYFNEKKGSKQIEVIEMYNNSVTSNMNLSFSFTANKDITNNNYNRRIGIQGFYNHININVDTEPCEFETLNYILEKDTGSYGCFRARHINSKFFCNYLNFKTTCNFLPGMKYFIESDSGPKQGAYLNFKSVKKLSSYPYHFIIPQIRYRVDPQNNATYLFNSRIFEKWNNFYIYFNNFEIANYFISNYKYALCTGIFDTLIKNINNGNRIETLTKNREYDYFTVVNSPVYRPDDLDQTSPYYGSGDFGAYIANITGIYILYDYLN